MSSGASRRPLRHSTAQAWFPSRRGSLGEKSLVRAAAARSQAAADRGVRVVRVATRSHSTLYYHSSRSLRDSGSRSYTSPARRSSVHARVELSSQPACSANKPTVRDGGVPSDFIASLRTLRARSSSAVRPEQAHRLRSRSSAFAHSSRSVRTSCTSRPKRLEASTTEVVRPASSFADRAQPAPDLARARRLVPQRDAHRKRIASPFSPAGIRFHPSARRRRQALGVGHVVRRASRRPRNAWTANVPCLSDRRARVRGAGGAASGDARARRCRRVVAASPGPSP